MFTISLLLLEPNFAAAEFSRLVPPFRSSYMSSSWLERKFSRSLFGEGLVIFALFIAET